MSDFRSFRNALMTGADDNRCRNHERLTAFTVLCRVHDSVSVLKFYPEFVKIFRKTVSKCRLHGKYFHAKKGKNPY